MIISLSIPNLPLENDKANSVGSAIFGVVMPSFVDQVIKPF